VTEPQQTSDPKQLLAAIDLGSNSFHMVVAQRVQGEIRTIEKMGRKSSLAPGWMRITTCPWRPGREDWSA